VSRGFKISIGFITVAVVVYFVPWARLSATRDFPVVKHAGIEGAIIPSRTVQGWQNALGVDAEGFWTPSPQEVELVETRLKEALQKAVKDPAQLNEYAKTSDSQKYLSQQIAQILSHYGEYRRQYIGLVIHGKRHIYVNSFSSRDSASDYTKQFVMVLDGGFWFWQILYSMDDGTFLNLSINGEA
jgi:hypothetical protein